MRRKGTTGATEKVFTDASPSGPPENELRWSEEERLRLLIEGVKDCALFMLDPEGRVAFWNRGAERLYGYLEKEMLGRHFSELYLPEEARAGKPALNLQTAAQGSFQGEGWRLRKDGSRFWAEAIITAIPDPQGNLRGFAKVTRDISRRRQAEDALRSSEERYRRIVETAPEGIWLLDQDWKTLLVNTRLAHLLGFQPDEMMGRHLAEFADEEGRGIIGDLVMRREKGLRKTQDLKLLRRDGTPVWTKLTTSTVTTEPGEFLGALAMVTDITQRERTEDALRDSEAKYRSLYTAMDEAVALHEMLFDEAGNAVDYVVLDVNPAYEANVGLSRGAIVGRKISERFRPPPFLDIYAKVASTGEPVFFEAHFAPLQKHFSISAFSQGPAKFATVFRDVTDRKLAEESFHQLSGRLLRLQDEERRRLARELHDTTGQKLAVLLLMLKRLMAHPPHLDAKAQALLADGHALAEQCANEVRTFSYLLHPPLLDELGLAGAVRDYADGFARRSGLRVDLEVSPGLGRLPREMELTLFRVLQESLSNVHRHSGSRTVSIRLTQTDGDTRLEVQDAGCGVRLKIDPASGETSPSKLGVGIVGMRERLRQLGGRLEIESTGSGTTVRAILSRDRP